MSTAPTLIWTTIAAAGLLTFALRWAFIALIDHVSLPEPVRRALGFVPAAVLSAIIWPAVLVQGGGLAVGPDNLRLIAALLAALVAWRTRSILYTLVAGMAALWLLIWMTG